MNIIYENPRHPHIVKGPPCHAFVAVKDVIEAIEAFKKNPELLKMSFKLPKNGTCKECAIAKCQHKETK